MNSEKAYNAGFDAAVEALSTMDRQISPEQMPEGLAGLLVAALEALKFCAPTIEDAEAVLAIAWAGAETRTPDDTLN